MTVLFIGILIVLVCVFLQKRESFADVTYDDMRRNMVKAEMNAAKEEDPCVQYTSCKTCSSVAVCGWCPNTRTCTAVDRWGFPFSADCHPSVLALYPDRCYQ
jgi:hypothetical protein